jgi:hypothetical protein
MNIDLSVPIWTIEHVAAALHLSVDAAREYTYRADFPASKAGFGRNLWLREAVLAWFADLPARAPSTKGRRTSGAVPRATGQHPGTRTTASDPSTNPQHTPAPAPARIKPYRPRAR